MLYQLPTVAVIIVFLLDLAVLGMLYQFWQYPGSSAAKWAAILGFLVVFTPLCGFKLLFASPGSAASTPGVVTLLNPQHQFARLYYLEKTQSGPWEVLWTEYLLNDDASFVVEIEGALDQRIALSKAGKWHYAPVRFSESYASTLTLPSSFATVDETGQLAQAITRYCFTEYANLLSNILTLGILVLAGGVVSQQLWRGRTQVLTRA